MADKPKAKNSFAEQELDKAEQQFKKFDEEVKELTLDRMSAAPKEEVEPQTKLSQKDIEKSKDIYLKPNKIISSKEKFNEKYREDFTFSKEYVQFIAENKEIIGETIELWTKPFPGCNAEFWQVPVNKPVWGPRYLAERIRGCQYSRLQMDESAVIGGNESTVQYMGRIVADKRISRLTAEPVTSRKSVFMGAGSF